MAQKTIFKRIIDREIPADIIYEDEQCLAFRDIHPQAPTHILVIPKQEIPTLDDLTPAEEGLVGHLFTVMQKLARGGPGRRLSGVRQLRPRRRPGGVPPALPSFGRPKTRWPPG